MKVIISVGLYFFTLGIAVYHATKGNLEFEILFIFLAYINQKNAKEAANEKKQK